MTYYRRPIKVEALQYTGKNSKEIELMLGSSNRCHEFTVRSGEKLTKLIVSDHMGSNVVEVGEYVVLDNGLVKVYDENDFNKLYACNMVEG